VAVFRRQTRSLCPACGQLVPAAIGDDGVGLAMTVACPQHGESVRPFLRSGDFYRQIDRDVDRGNEQRIPDDCRDVESFLPAYRDVYIDVTERCNFNCPICYTNANRQPPPDLSRQEIFSRIDRLPRPMVISLLGGEPALREDLADLVRYIAGRGHLVKLITNGTLLTAARIEALRAAGLRWIILQFDGFRDEIMLALRGRKLLDEKMEIIERLTYYQMTIVLASMIVPRVNDDQVGRILHFALCHPRIVQIGFLPAANIGRSELKEQPVDLEAGEFNALLEKQTGGRIRQTDFVRGIREGQRFARLTGNLAYKARTCCYGLFLYHDGYHRGELARSGAEPDVAALHAGKVLMPIDRALVSPAGLGRPARLAGALRTIARWNQAPENPHLLGVVVEKFRNRACLDFDDAKNCTKAYLTRDGFTPNCLYNILYRGSATHG
jgi:uncharacterized radical SAM superfamily Fe-S cluster-containing enzyme